MYRQSLEKKIENHIIEYKDNHYRLAYSYVKNCDDALDIVQESIYKAFSSINTIKDTGSIKTWFYRIIVNTSLDFLKKQKKLVELDEEILNYTQGTFDTYENIDLQKALEDLSEKNKSIIVLRFFEDLKIKEIAKVLDENVNTVKTRLYKSLKNLNIKMRD